MVAIKEMLAPKGSKCRPGYALKPTYITIHNTANTNSGAGAENHGKYLQGGRNLAMLRRRGVRRWRLRIDCASHVLSLPRPASRGAWLRTFRAVGRETMRLATADKEKATRPKLGCVAKRWLAPRKVHTFLDGLNCRGFFENVKQEWSDRPRLLTALTLRP